MHIHYSISAIAFVAFYSKIVGHVSAGSTLCLTISFDWIVFYSEFILTQFGKHKKRLVVLRASRILERGRSKLENLRKLIVTA